MSLRRAGAGTFRLLRAYATEAAAQYGAQHNKQILRQVPAVLQLSHLPLTPASQRHNGWWQSHLQYRASADVWRQLATAPDSSSGGKDKEDKSKTQMPDAEVSSDAASGVPSGQLYRRVHM